VDSGTTVPTGAFPVTRSSKSTGRSYARTPKDT
jgi:hypothetical protein